MAMYIIFQVTIYFYSDSTEAFLSQFLANTDRSRILIVRSVELSIGCLLIIAFEAEAYSFVYLLSADRIVYWRFHSAVLVIHLIRWASY